MLTDIQGLLNTIGPINRYTPLFEAITNSIQSIAESKRTDGCISIKLIREQGVLDLDAGVLAPVDGFEVRDNGIGFNPENLASFEAAYSRKKYDIGGKGFGRFSFLKIFGKVVVDSTFYINDTFKRIGFDFSVAKNGISEPQSLQPIGDSCETVVLLTQRMAKDFDKQIETISRKIMEHFLIFFAEGGEFFPDISIQDGDGGKPISLNELFSSSSDITAYPVSEVLLKKDEVEQKLTIRTFKVFFSRDRSTISLCANNREVEILALSKYIPEFKENFSELRGEDGEVESQYTVCTYVLGPYLNDSVSIDRGKFNFPKQEPDGFYPFSEADIARAVSKHLAEKFQILLKERNQEKTERINRFIENEEPWYVYFKHELDFSSIPSDISDKELSVELFKQKQQREVQAKEDAYAVIESISSGTEDDDFEERLSALIATVSDIGRTELAHYVANRKLILEFFKKTLEWDAETKKYKTEAAVHDIIFPRKKDKNSLEYSDHNLWLLDEKLNFCEYIASDKPLKAKGKVPDLLLFDNLVAVRDGEEKSNPVTIFEFKRPQREDPDDPVEQIGMYAEKLRKETFVVPATGRPMEVDPSTPFYGHVVCDLTPKIKEYCEKRHQLTLRPDKQGYYGFHNGYGIYFEIISFTQMLRDSELRNRIFFKKLGIE